MIRDADKITNRDLLLFRCASTSVEVPVVAALVVTGWTLIEFLCDFRSRGHKLKELSQEDEETKQQQQ